MSSVETVIVVAIVYALLFATHRATSDTTH
jgi:hypothetical protein